VSSTFLMFLITILPADVSSIIAIDAAIIGTSSSSVWEAGFSSAFLAAGAGVGLRAGVDFFSEPESLSKNLVTNCKTMRTTKVMPIPRIVVIRPAHNRWLVVNSFIFW